MDTTLYTQSFDYAKKHNEIKEFQASHKENMNCLWDIRATSEIYALTDRLDVFLNDLTDKYGAERPLYVLSRTVQEMNDKTFAPDVIEFANRYEYPDKDSVHSFTHLYVTDTKPTVIENIVRELSNQIPQYTLSEDFMEITREQAEEYYKNNIVSVYTLSSNGTERPVYKLSDIEEHTGIFAVDTTEWECYQRGQERMKKLIAAESEKENLLFFSKGCAVGIYQLKDTPEAAGLAFRNIDELKRKGIIPDKSNYVLVYAYEVQEQGIKDRGAFLETVYRKFNLDHPQDYTGHSLSVSDVVVLQEQGELTAYYVDSFGYTKLENFIEKVDTNINFKKES